MIIFGNAILELSVVLLRDCEVNVAACLQYIMKRFEM